MVVASCSCLPEYNGHAYKLYTSATTYNNAKSSCESTAGYLAESTSQEENSVIKGTKLHAILPSLLEPQEGIVTL